MSEWMTNLSHFESRGSLAEWRDKLKSNLHDIDIDTPDNSEPYYATLSSRQMRTLHMVRCIEPPQFRSRTRSGIARDENDHIYVVCNINGEIYTEQFGRKCVVKAADCFIVDCGSPFLADVRTFTDCFSIGMPRDMFKKYFCPEDVSCISLNEMGSWGKVTSSFIMAAANELENGFPNSSYYIGDQLINLLELSFKDESYFNNSSRNGVLRRARAIMREFCHDEYTDPLSIANRMGISRRYLYKIFSQNGTTFCKELDSMRIEKATGLLSTNSKRHLTIAEIGFECGFPDAPQFTRKFRSLMGVTPSQYLADASRKQVL